MNIDISQVYNMHVIYGLIDPFTKLLRYIGYTSNPADRYRRHHNPSQLKGNDHKANWLNKILSNGKKATMILIKEYESADKLHAAEEYWYDFFISNGADLVNDSKRIGLGTKKGVIFSQNHCKNISLSHMGEKNHNYGKPKSPETKQKMAEAHIGEKSSSHKLTWKQVEQIKQDTRSQRKIAKDYGVSQTTIWQIRQNRTWKDQK